MGEVREVPGTILCRESGGKQRPEPREQESGREQGRVRRELGRT